MVYIADETKRKFTSTIHSLKLQVTDKSSATDASRRVCMSVSYNHVTHFKYHLDPFSLLYECYLCSHHITEHRMRTLSYRVLALYICGPNNQLQLSLVVFHFVKLMGQLDDVVPLPRYLHGWVFFSPCVTSDSISLVAGHTRLPFLDDLSNLARGVATSPSPGDVLSFVKFVGHGRIKVEKNLKVG